MSVLGVDLDHLVGEGVLNAGLAWAGTGALVAIAAHQAVRGDPAVTAVTGTIAVLAGAPGPFYRSLAVTAPWEVVALAAAACAWNAAVPGPVAFYLSVAVGAAVAVLDLHLFTSARASHRVAAGLVVVGTAATAGAWVALRWLATLVAGGPPLPSHEALMGELLAAAAIGLVGGAGFELYVLGWEARLDRLTPLLREGP
jgi:hypothetical protein